MRLLEGGAGSLEALSDRELARLCADADAAGWRELTARHERRVLLVLLRAGVAEAELTDLRQEVYARLLAQKGAALRTLRAEREGALGAFLAQVALRVAIDHGRSRGSRARREVSEEEARDVASPSRPVDELVAVQQGRERFARALLAAASGQHAARDLLVLRAHFSDGLNPGEIAQMGTGLTTKGIETLLRRARMSIEAALGAGASREVKEK